MRCFDLVYVEVKKCIEVGDIGKLIYFKGVSCDGNVFFEEFIKYSGGIFLDVVIYDYDIVCYLMG